MRSVSLSGINSIRISLKPSLCMAAGLKYEDEIIEDLKKRTAPDAKSEKPLKKVREECCVSLSAVFRQC